MREIVRKPAMAYFAMESIIGPSYFKKRPPVAGKRVIAYGNDWVATQWDMTSEEFARINPILQGDPRIAGFSCCDFDESKRV